MKVSFSNAQKSVQSIVILVDEKRRLSADAKKLDQQHGGVISNALDSKSFAGKQGDTQTVILTKKNKLTHAFLVGTSNHVDHNQAQTIGGYVVNLCQQQRINTTQILLGNIKNSGQIAAHIAYGAQLKAYRFDKYKTKNDQPESKISLHLVSDKHKEASSLYKSLDSIAKGVFLSRDVVSEPPNYLYPETYAKRIKESFQGLRNVKIKILREASLKKLGMGALLGVGQGSINESHVVIIEYTGGRKSQKPVAFVGKGVTFDTGGISLKPSGGMEDMKYDMGGSAAVVGTMRALAGRSAKVNAIGIVGLVENMPGHNAQRPSDVVTSLSGQTIEVLNTDAEGRLVLADILWHVQEKYKPQTVIDLATLTGAIVVALGGEYAGLFSNDDTLSNQLTRAGETTKENVWRFPLGEAYDKMIDSKIADMQNISSGRGAGSITAAQFLQRFIKDKVAWAHIDIAGVAWTKTSKEVCPEGATGFGVRLLDQFIADNYEK